LPPATTINSSVSERYGESERVVVDQHANTLTHGQGRPFPPTCVCVRVPDGGPIRRTQGFPGPRMGDNVRDRPSARCCPSRLPVASLLCWPTDLLARCGLACHAPARSTSSRRRANRPRRAPEPPESPEAERERRRRTLRVRDDARGQCAAAMAARAQARRICTAAAPPNGAAPTVRPPRSRSRSLLA
jgi:hypothetical protein